MERVLARTITPAFGLPPLRRIIRLLRLWQQRVRTRHQLAGLDDHQLADIGISRSERLAELEKPFWR
ncbi:MULTISPECIES: DUF1127 domain-containing protein [Pseudomonadaceae]|uniref:DUF1127 domain-containing protein n=1 Tax=Pseudomonadaceae TaxID=135621 RepID=UPI001CA3C23F|nr:DUF1127 domain-containing protein [Pseudomonas sp. DNDY-54]